MRIEGRGRVAVGGCVTAAEIGGMCGSIICAIFVVLVFWCFRCFGGTGRLTAEGRGGKCCGGRISLTCLLACTVRCGILQGNSTIFKFNVTHALFSFEYFASHSVSC